MIDRNSKIYSLLKIMAILLAIQVIRIIIKQIIFQFIEKSSFNNDLISLIEMALLVVVILLFCKNQNMKLSIFSNIQSKGQRIVYYISTILVLFLVVSTPIFNGGLSSIVIIPMIISTVATPIFEELIFRGYVWNELKHYYRNEFTIYIINTLLFAIWHLGYVDSILFKMTLMGNNTGVPFVMLMKVITGLCFGVILGFIRLKSKNCYTTMLVHSFMNIFGR